MASKPTEEQIQKEFERLSRDAQAVSVRPLMPCRHFLLSHHYLRHIFSKLHKLKRMKRIVTITHNSVLLPSRLFLGQVAIKIGELESDLKEHE